MLRGRSLVCLTLAVSACSPEVSPDSPGGFLADAGTDTGPPEKDTSAVERVSTPSGDEDASTNEDVAVATDDGEAGDTAFDIAIDIADVRPPAHFACTLLIGINATGEWYREGYERLVDDARWELVQVHNGFIEKWADPNDAYWSTAIDSACADNPRAPDRIMFVLSNFDYTTVEQWYPPLVRVLANLQQKFPSVQNIELMSWVRAPGNKPCPQAPANRSTISAGEDQAMARAAQDFPRLVTVAPAFEAHACSEYTDNPPHPTPAGGAAWAKMIAAHYAP
jgi:hypothetical protein